MFAPVPSDPFAGLLTAEAAYFCRTPSGALAVAVAACLTGSDAAAVRRLPDTTGLERRIILQRAHAVALDGLSVLQLLRLVGADPVEAGTADRCRRDELAGLLRAGAAAALWLEIPDASKEGCLDLAWFAWTCRAAGVPSVALTRARTSPLTAFDAGVDLVVIDIAAGYGGVEGGLIAGRADLVAACQSHAQGIGALFLADADLRQEALLAVRRAAAEPERAMAWSEAGEAAKVPGLVSLGRAGPAVRSAQ